MPPADEQVAQGGAPPPAPPGQVWDDWPPSTSPLLTESSSRENASWSLRGRRAVVLGTGQSGVQEIRVCPLVIAGGVRLEVNGRPPGLVSLKVSPDEIVRVLEAGAVQLTERITTALDHPLIFWSIVADTPVPIRLTWVTDLPGNEPSGAPLGQMIGEEGSTEDTHIRVGREDAEPRFQVLPVAGVAAITGPVTAPAGNDALAFEVRSDRLLRAVLAAGADTAELERALDALRRRRLRAFRQDRILHARRIEDRLVSLVSPDPELDRAFGWAKVNLEAMLEARPHLGRQVAGDAIGVACATLAIGDRDIARDVLRPLRLGENGADRAPLLRLADYYARWTGEPVPRVTAARGGIEASDTVFELTGSRGDPAALVLGVIEGLWGIRPDAPRGAVRVRPSLPAGWPEMALRRLRVGPTTLDLRVRRRPGRTVVMVRRTGGPPIRLTVGLRGRTATGPVMIDQTEVGGQEVSFTPDDSHEVDFHDE